MSGPTNIVAKLPKDPALEELWMLIADLERPFPIAAACLAEDLQALTVHLRYPGRLRRRLRSTNLLERSLEQVRRRTKVIGPFPGETSCLRLCWAVLDCIITSSYGLGLTEPDRQDLSRLKDPQPHQE